MDWFSIIASSVSGLLGAAIGAAGAYLATSKIESEKWIKQKRDKESEDLRQELILYKKWVEPIYLNLSKIKMFEDMVHSHTPRFQQSFPKVTQEFQSIELTPPLRLLSPAGINQSAQVIATKADEIRGIVLAINQIAILTFPEGRSSKTTSQQEKEIADLFTTLFTKTEVLEKILNAFINQRRNEYRKTGKNI